MGETIKLEEFNPSIENGINEIKIDGNIELRNTVRVISHSSGTPTPGGVLVLQDQNGNTYNVITT